MYNNTSTHLNINYVHLTGGTNTALLLQLLTDKADLYGNPFYFFYEPCKHPKYKLGESFLEVLNFKAKCTQRTLSKMGQRTKRGCKLDYTALFWYWRHPDNITYFKVNYTYLNLRLKTLQEDTLRDKAHHTYRKVPELYNKHLQALNQPLIDFSKPIPNNKNSRGFIYLVKSIHGYKIGQTKKPKKRFEIFSVKLPFKIEILRMVEVNNYLDVEKGLHLTFQNNHLNGEWFDMSKQDIQLFDSITKNKKKAYNPKVIRFKIPIF